MGTTDIDINDTVLYITKINALVSDGREDLIAAIIADFERGRSSEPMGGADEA